MSAYRAGAKMSVGSNDASFHQKINGTWMLEVREALEHLRSNDLFQAVWECKRFVNEI